MLAHPSNARVGAQSSLWRFACCLESIEENEHHSVVSMLKMINFPGITFSYGVEAMFLSLSIDLVVPD